jgi:hypothetical protein
LSQRGNRVLIDIPRQFESEVFPEAKVRFFLKTLDLELSSVRDATGNVAHLVVHDAGGNLEASKLKS